jgi:HEAT repeats
VVKRKATPHATSFGTSRAGQQRPDQGHEEHSILNLQRTAGNQAVQRLVEEPGSVPRPPAVVQRQRAPGRKSTPISSPADKAYEQLNIVRQGILPLEEFRKAHIRALSFDERQALQFQRALKAIFELGDLRDQRAVLTLIAVVEDKLWGQPKRGYSPTQKQLLQEAAVQSLAQIGGPVARQKLIDLLNSADPKVRSIASRAMAGATGSQAVSDLLAALQTEKDAAIRAQIIRSLGNVGRGSGNQEKQTIVQALLREMESSPLDIQIAAVNALGALAVKSATEALLKLARQHLSIATLVSDIARALGEIGDDRAVELLAILLKDHGSPSVRSEAALALGKIRTAKALAALKSRLSKEKEARVKASITTAINGKPAVLQWKFP